MSTLMNTLLQALQKPDVGGSFYSKDSSVRHKIGLTIRDALLQTHRFHLSTKATEMASMYSMNVSDVKQQVLKLARPGFDSVWLEWPLANQLSATGLEKHESAPDIVGVMVRKTADGYIITDAFAVNQTVIFSPVSILYSINEAIDYKKYAEDTAFFCACLDRTHEIVPLWQGHTTALAALSKCLIGGSPVENTNNMLNDKFFDILSAPNAIHVLTPGLGKIIRDNIFEQEKTNPRLADSLKEVIAERLTETAGQFKFTISALALINTPTYVSKSTVKPGHAAPGQKKTSSTRNRNPVYDYVELKIPHTVIIQTLQGESWEKTQRARHEVQGHLCYSHKLGDPNCKHIWANQSETREVCLLCDAKRWWRKDHNRGNADIGVKAPINRLVVTK